jgi:site-specific DNA-cytosine methylase
MNVLSLFDGVSCAFLALKEAGIPVKSYFASEVDDKCITVSRENHGDLITHIGDVKKVNESKVPVDKIDLLIGGSPCQDVSCAGKRKGLTGERSGLFYEYLRILHLFKPTWFILENVGSMKNSDKDEITKYLGVQPIEINSNLVTAQNRKRYYWTNIPNVTPPADKKITIKQVSQESGNVFIVASRGRVGPDGKHFQNLEPRSDGKTNTLTSVLKDNYLSVNGELRNLTPEEYEELQGIRRGYTKAVAKGSRYKMVGNAFTVPIIAHILGHIPLKGNAKKNKTGPLRTKTAKKQGML